jgi:hypothetical protein
MVHDVAGFGSVLLSLWLQQPSDRGPVQASLAVKRLDKPVRPAVYPGGRGEDSCDRSAAELAAELLYLGVAQGEAKVRQVLRSAGPFTQVWRGRWQAGHAAPALLRYLSIQAAKAEVP